MKAIRAETAARGQTIRGLSKQAGIPERVMIRALNCERDLNMAQLSQIASALGVSPSYLVSEGERRRVLNAAARTEDTA